MTTLIAEKPFVSAVHEKFWYYICHQCYKWIQARVSVAVFCCEKCGKVKYCSKECRAEDSELHSLAECQASRFNHACDPDMTYYIDGSILRMKFLRKPPDTLTPEKINSLTICYVSTVGRSALSVGDQRMIEMQDKYHFKCTCKACMDKNGDFMKLFSVKEECENCGWPFLVCPISKLPRMICSNTDCLESKLMDAEKFANYQKVLGAMLLVMSIWVRLDNDFQTKLNDAIQKSAGTPVELYQMYIVLYLLATIGGLLCLTGFLGCCGACSESPCLLALFFTVVLALFLTKIALTIYIFVKKDTLKRELSGWFNNNVFSHYHNENNTDIQKIIDQIQTKFDCCGANGCKDFLFPEIPSTCNCDQNQEGCIDKVFTELRKYMVLLVGVTITVLAVEFLAMVFSCIILDAIRNNANDYAYY